MAHPKRISIIIAFAALYVIWGSTYLGILFAIRSIPPLLMAGSRFVLAGFILYCFAASRGRSHVFSLSEWRAALIVGGCLLLGGNGGVTLAEQYIPSGLAALLVATVPIYIALLSWLCGQSERPTGITMAGLAGGFIGVAVLIGPALWFLPNHNSKTWIGACILLCSSLIWSIGSLYSRYSTAAHSTLLAAAQQMLCGGALLLLVGAAKGELSGFDPHRITALSLGAFVYLVLIGGIIGYGSYAWLLRHCDPAKVATYAYVNPIVAVLLGTMFAGERLTTRIIVGAILIIGSVAVVIMAQQMRGEIRRSSSRSS